jgi:hypothetical protein
MSTLPRFDITWAGIAPAARLLQLPFTSLRLRATS